MMITGIQRNTPPPAAAPGRRSAAAPADGVRAAQTFDQFRLSARPTGEEARAREIAARLTQDLRARPTAGELSALRESVRSGAYAPDAREIAARMLLLGEV